MCIYWVTKMSAEVPQYKQPRKNQCFTADCSRMRYTESLSSALPFLLRAWQTKPLGCTSHEKQSAVIGARHQKYILAQRIQDAVPLLLLKIPFSLTPPSPILPNSGADPHPTRDGRRYDTPIIAAESRWQSGKVTHQLAGQVTSH